MSIDYIFTLYSITKYKMLRASNVYLNTLYSTQLLSIVFLYRYPFDSRLRPNYSLIKSTGLPYHKDLGSPVSMNFNLSFPIET